MLVSCHNSRAKGGKTCTLLRRYVPRKRSGTKTSATDGGVRCQSDSEKLGMGQDKRGIDRLGRGDTIDRPQKRLRLHRLGRLRYVSGMGATTGSIGTGQVWNGKILWATAPLVRPTRGPLPLSTPNR